jgi:hypothetical protein
MPDSPSSGFTSACRLKYTCCRLNYTSRRLKYTRCRLNYTTAGLTTLFSSPGSMGSTFYSYMFLVGYFLCRRAPIPSGAGLVYSIGGRDD